MQLARDWKLWIKREFSNKDSRDIMAESFDNFLIKTCSVKNVVVKRS